MTTLFKRDDSAFWYAWLKDPRDPEGLVKRSTRTANKTQAARVASKLQVEIDEQVEQEEAAALNACGLTWLDALPLFLADGDLSDQTRASYVNIGTVVTNILGDFDLGQLTHEQLKAFCQQRRQMTVKPPGAKDTGRRVSDPTIRKNLSTISAVYKHVMEWSVPNAPSINPLKTFDRGFLKNSKIVDRHLRPIQFQQCLDACKTQTHRAMLMLMVGTGMRTGEVMSLYWGEIDFKETVIEFGNVDPERTKTSRSRRIMLLAPVVSELTAHRTAQMAAREYDRDGLVFPSFVIGEDGKKVARRRYDLKYLIKMVRKRAGIARYWNHGLRHTFASWARQQGIDPDAVRRALGHTTTSTTDRYAHHVDESAMAQLRTLELPATAQFTAQSKAFSKKPGPKKGK